MKIKSVSARWLHVPIPEDRQHTSDFGRVSTFDSTLVRVETENGMVGHGEAKAEAGSAASCGALCTMIEQELAPKLVGEDARDISRLWDAQCTGRHTEACRLTPCRFVLTHEKTPCSIRRLP